MNESITKINKALAGLLGLCWHEDKSGGWIYDLYDEEFCIHCKASSKHNPRPDLTQLVDIKCECDNGWLPIKNIKGTQCPERAIPEQCPTCNGVGIRRISRLQQVLENRQEQITTSWERFTWSLQDKIKRKQSRAPGWVDEYTDILTDTIQLGQAYLAWKGE